MYKTYSRFQHYNYNLRKLIRLNSTITSKANPGLQFVTSFSDEERYKVLEILNTSSANDFLKFKLNEAQINKLIDWRETKGPFNSFSDILEVQGLKENTLKKLCTKIATNELGHAKHSNGTKIHLKKLLTPSLNNQILNNLNSVTAIQLNLSCFSWAKLEKDGNYLVDWNSEDFYPLALKMSSADVFVLAIDILNKIPKADVYIFESPINLNFNRSKPAAQIAPYNKKMELSSMLLCLLNTSPKHNSCEENSQKMSNKVFFLKTGLSARAFNLKVGTENVSGISTVNDILNNSTTLPCAALNVEPDIKNNFSKSISKKQDLLAQSLMLSITFMELFVYTNQQYYDILKIDGTRVL